jgi:hypothetical protein
MSMRWSSSRTHASELFARSELASGMRKMIAKDRIIFLHFFIASLDHESNFFGDYVVD